MTRKDYGVIARALEKLKHSTEHPFFCELIADALEHENSRFDRAHFYDAAGLTFDMSDK